MNFLLLSCLFLPVLGILLITLLGKTEKTTTTTFYFMLLGALATGLHWPFASVKQDFSLEALLIIAGLGLTGLLAQLAETQSFRLGEASIIAPVMYTMIIWAALFDYIFWMKIPGWNIILGAAIIISANLFILLRENHLKVKGALPTYKSPTPPDIL